MNSIYMGVNMKTNIVSISSNFSLHTRINIEVEWETEPIDEREESAREAFATEIQEVANYFNESLGPNLLSAFHDLQKAKVANGN